MTNRELFKLAGEAKKNSYSPYSDFRVGSALLTDKGDVYTGANVENSAYGETVCAERIAFFKAITDGQKTFKKIAIDCDTADYCFPCGSCRQVMKEFCKDDFEIILMENGKIKVFKLGELLPFSFSL